MGMGVTMCVALPTMDLHKNIEARTTFTFHGIKALALLDLLS